MDSIFLHQKANELVQSAGSRDLRAITKTVGMQVSEIPFESISGFFTFQWDFYNVLSIISLIDKPNKWFADMR